MTTPGVEVIEGDCLDVLPILDLPGAVAVVTDPPYGIAYSSNMDNCKGTWSASWKGERIQGDQNPVLRDWIIGWAEERSLPWAVFGNWKCQRPPQSRGVLIWDKGPAFGMGDLSFPWKMSWEEIYVGGPGWRGHRGEGVLRDHIMVTWESKGRFHPTQKPVSLIRHLLSKLPSDAVILDPFAGSGSTGVACLKTGHRCILIEKHPKYIKVIHRRLSDAATPLFDIASQ